jgi:3-hydroxyacyl-CoA dehydrogenase
LREADVVAFHAHETLHIARQQALALAESGYRPPLPARRIPVAGDVGIATFKMLLVNMLEGRFISEYDYEIASRIATVLCGGEVDRGALVDEDWLLRLEREQFVALAQQEKTQARIAHMLKTGKPLRN